MYIGVAAVAVATPIARMGQEIVDRISRENLQTIAVRTPTEIANIAVKIQNWELLAHLLGLSDPQVEAIKKDHEHYEEQKLAVRYRFI